MLPPMSLIPAGLRAPGSLAVAPARCARLGAGSARVAALALLLSGCAAPVLEESASVSIVFPESSQSTVYCPTLPVVVDIDGFELSPEGIDQASVDGQGHWHLEINGEYVGNSTSHTFLIDGALALEPGRTHALTAVLRTNQHEALDPDVRSSEIEIEVEDSDDCLGGVGPDADTGA